MELFSGFANLPKISLPVGGRDDDLFSDRLNYKYTSFILIMSSFIVTYKIFEFNHIQCWVPAVFAMYERYINLYCWISNTYFVSFNEQTNKITNKHERMIKYYQWVPLILLVLAFGFVIPRFIYRFLTKQTGVDIFHMADAAVNYVSIDQFESRKRTLLYLTNTIHHYSSFKRNNGCNHHGDANDTKSQENSSILMTFLGCRRVFEGAYLTIFYLFTKLAYISNSMTQLFLMNLFLGFKYNMQGLSFLKDFANNLFNRESDPKASYIVLDTTNKYSERVFPLDFNGEIASPYTSGVQSETIQNSLLQRYFPRQSACDFRVRMNVDSLVQNFTVQCVLPINLFNEQLFTLIWAWLWIVFIINCYEMVTWIVRILPKQRYKYIRHRIHIEGSEQAYKMYIDKFINDYLSYDGVFLLRILTLNSSDIVTHKIVNSLWKNYIECKRMGNKESQSTKIREVNYYDESNVDESVQKL